MATAQLRLAGAIHANKGLFDKQSVNSRVEIIKVMLKEIERRLTKERYPAHLREKKKVLTVEMLTITGDIKQTRQEK